MLSGSGRVETTPLTAAGAGTSSPAPNQSSERRGDHSERRQTTSSSTTKLEANGTTTSRSRRIKSNPTGSGGGAGRMVAVPSSSSSAPAPAGSSAPPPAPSNSSGQAFFKIYQSDFEIADGWMSKYYDENAVYEAPFVRLKGLPKISAHWNALRLAAKALSLGTAETKFEITSISSDPTRIIVHGRLRYGSYFGINMVTTLHLVSEASKKVKRQHDQWDFASVVENFVPSKSLLTWFCGLVGEVEFWVVHYVLLLLSIFKLWVWEPIAATYAEVSSRGLSLSGVFLSGSSCADASLLFVAGRARTATLSQLQLQCGLLREVLAERAEWAKRRWGDVMVLARQTWLIGKEKASVVKEKVEFCLARAEKKLRPAVAKTKKRAAPILQRVGLQWLTRAEDDEETLQMICATSSSSKTSTASTSAASTFGGGHELTHDQGIKTGSCPASPTEDNPSPTDAVVNFPAPTAKILLQQRASPEVVPETS